MAARFAKGTALQHADQSAVLSSYVHRLTGQHRPKWSQQPRPDGSSYPVQFLNDADWLANTEFAVRSDGRLDRRAKSCTSSPTWPHNPELRVQP